VASVTLAQSQEPRLEEGISTRMLICPSAHLARCSAGRGYSVALVRPITDDQDIRDARGCGRLLLKRPACVGLPTAELDR
jgi:hypothetical protein